MVTQNVAEIVNMVTEAMPKIDNAILRLILFPHSLRKEQRVREVAAALNEVKWKKEIDDHPSYTLYSVIREAVGCNESIVQTYVDTIKSHTCAICADVPISECERILKDYHEWISLKLSTVGSVSYYDVMDKLTRIIFDPKIDDIGTKKVSNCDEYIKHIHSLESANKTLRLQATTKQIETIELFEKMLINTLTEMDEMFHDDDEENSEVKDINLTTILLTIRTVAANVKMDVIDAELQYLRSKGELKLASVDYEE